MLIKQLAEDRGCHALVEQQSSAVPEASMWRAKKGQQKIACEVCVTTTTDQELVKIQKCLAGGYGTMIVVARDAKKTLRAVQSTAGVANREPQVAPRSARHERSRADQRAGGFVRGMATATRTIGYVTERPGQGVTVR